MPHAIASYRLWWQVMLASVSQTDLKIQRTSSSHASYPFAPYLVLWWRPPCLEWFQGLDYPLQKLPKPTPAADRQDTKGRSWGKATESPYGSITHISNIAAAIRGRASPNNFRTLLTQLAKQARCYTPIQCILKRKWKLFPKCGGKITTGIDYVMF